MSELRARRDAVWDAVFAATFTALSPKIEVYFRTVDWTEIGSLSRRAADAAVVEFYKSEAPTP